MPCPGQRGSCCQLAPTSPTATRVGSLGKLALRSQGCRYRHRREMGARSALRRWDSMGGAGWGRRQAGHGYSSATLQRGPWGAWFCWSTVTGVETTGWYARNVMSWSCRGSSGFHLHKLSLPHQYLIQSSLDSRTVQVGFQPRRALPPGTKPTKKGHNFCFFPRQPGELQPLARRQPGGMKVLGAIRGQIRARVCQPPATAAGHF